MPTANQRSRVNLGELLRPQTGYTQQANATRNLITQEVSSDMKSQLGTYIKMLGQSMSTLLNFYP